MCVCKILRHLVTSEQRRPFSVVGFCVKGVSHFSFIAYLRHAETEGQVRTAQFWHFTFRIVCNITVCNLLFAVPTRTREPLTSARRRCKLLGTKQSGRELGARIRCMCCDAQPGRSCCGKGKKLFYQSRTICQRPWLLRDEFCLCVHRDTNSQLRIVAIFTVVDSQNLQQRNLPLFRCDSLITTVQIFTYRVSVVHYTQQSKH